MISYREPTVSEIETDAQIRRICSGFKLTLDQARDRVCEGKGWVNFAHCLKCKAVRGVK